MNKEELDALYQGCRLKVLNGEINKPLDYIGRLQVVCSESSLAMEVNAIKRDYEVMLSFITQGGVDPNRIPIKRMIQARLLRVLDTLHRNIRITLEEDEYAKAYRQTCDFDFADFMDRNPQRDKDIDFHEAVTLFFKKIWSSGHLTQEQGMTLYEYIEGQEIFVQKYMLNGLMLALMEYYDEEKLRIVSYYAQDSRVKLRAIASVAYVLTCMRYPQQVIHSGLHALRLEAKDVKYIQYSLLLQKKCEQVIELLNIDDKQDESTKTYHINLTDHLKEYVCDKKNTLKLLLRLEPDVVAGNSSIRPFYNLEFFQNIESWWMPYDQKHPYVTQKYLSNPQIFESRKSIYKLLCAVSNDVDAYLHLHFNEQHKIKVNIIDDDGKKVTSESFLENYIHHIEKDIHRQIKRVVQGVYRFYKFSKWAKDYESPFSENCFFAALPQFKFYEYLTEKDFHKMINILLLTGNSSACIACAEKCLEVYGNKSSVLAKIAFCNMDRNIYHKAIKYIEKAELASSDSDPLACMCKINYMMTYDTPKNTLKYIQKELKKLPSLHEQVLPYVATCYLKLYDYSKATKYLHEMVYKKIHLKYSCYQVIYCLFMQKAYDKARTYLEEYKNNNTLSSTDYYLFGAMIALAEGNMKDAIHGYQKFYTIRAEKLPDPDIAVDEIEYYKEELVRDHGVAEEDIELIINIITS